MAKENLDSPCVIIPAIINFFTTLITFHFWIGQYFLSQSIPKAFIALSLTILVGWLIEVLPPNDEIHCNQEIFSSWFVFSCFALLMGRGGGGTWKIGLIALSETIGVLCAIWMLAVVASPSWNKSATWVRTFPKRMKEKSTEAKKEKAKAKEEKEKLRAKEAELNNERLVDF